MPKINLLPREISELIAAGEVIDRPCSIVKELLENSIDSGATAITVEIKNGGTSFIRISDNGCGISEEDVPTAFLRHATSKIKNKDDLDSIMTLGFRGEALASVAAVAKVEVLTKLRDEQYGTHYVIEGGEEKLSEKCGCPDGTTIIVRDIFYNVPARRKFLKKDVTEGNSIASVIQKIALSHPEISLKLIRDNKRDIFTPGDNDVFSAIYAVFGKAFADGLIPVNYSENGITVTGYTVRPVHAKSNRSFQIFFINGRFVRSVTCTVSLEEAYRNLIMTGKFPSCVLNITLSPETVDVNVHPAKTEVRFSDEKLIFDSVYFAVKSAIMADDNLSAAAEKSEPVEEVYIPAPKPDYTVKTVVPEEKHEQLSFGSESKVYNKQEITATHTENSGIPEEKPLSELKPLKELENKNFKYITAKAFVKKEQPKSEPVVEEKIIPEYRVIGEVLKTYILVESEKTLVLIDKHAAHERILFEKLKAEGEGTNCQMLMTPETVPMTAEQTDAINTHLDDVMRIGFTVENITTESVDVAGIPAALDGESPSALIVEVADNILRCKSDISSTLIDELYHSVACKAAIKAHDKNDITELEKLVHDVFSDNRIRYCPHGRPVAVTITERDLEKMFKRVL